MKKFTMILSILLSFLLTSCDESNNIIDSSANNPSIEEDVSIDRSESFNSTEEEIVGKDSNEMEAGENTNNNEPKDSIAPELILIGQSNIKISVGGEFNDPGVDYSDESGPVTIEVFGSVDPMTPGIYEILYKATDSYNNSSTVKRQVEIIDTLPPVLQLVNDIVVVEWKSDFDLDKDFIVDNVTCYDNDQCEINTIGNLDVNIKNEYEIIIRAIDRVGLFDQKTVRFRVIDTTPPLAELIGQSTVQISFGTTWEDPGVFVQEVPNSYRIETSLADGYVFNKVGEIKKIYRVIDDSGNFTTLTRTINVVDNIAPILTLKGAARIVVEIGDRFIDPGVTFSDNTGTSVAITSSNNYPGNLLNKLMVLGSFQVNYYGTDESGNRSNEVTRIIEVVDTTKPIIRFNGTANPTQVVDYYIDQQFYGDFYDIDYGINYSDNSNDELTFSIDDGGFNGYEIGRYTFRYSVTDKSGNTSEEIVRRVNVGWSPKFNPLKKGKYYISISSQQIIPNRFYINSVNLILDNESILFKVARYDWRYVKDKLIFINLSETGVEHEFATYSSFFNLNDDIRYFAESDQYIGVNRSYKLDTQFTFVEISKNDKGDIVFDFLDENGNKNVLYELNSTTNYLSNLNGQRIVRMNGGLEHSLIIDEVSLDEYGIGDQIVIYIPPSSYSIIAGDNIILEGNATAYLNILTRIGLNKWTFNNPLS